MLSLIDLFFNFYKVVVKFCFYIPVSAGVLINFFLPTCIISNSKPFCSSCYFTFYTFLLFRLLFVVLIQFLNLVIIQNQVSYLLGHFYYLDCIFLSCAVTFFWCIESLTIMTEDQVFFRGGRRWLG